MFTLRGRKIVIGYNGEPTLRYGIHRELTFTAYGFWPVIVGVEKRSWK